jgi:lysophospholipase L1-like esterase
MTGLLVLSAVCSYPPPEPPKLDLKDGDRIVWLGGTLVEREQKYGYWETALHAAFPKINFTLRNLGWSGDTVYGDSRAGFDTPKEGFKRLVDQTLALKPTVIFVSYGQNESFDGEAGLPKFEKGLESLLDALKPANARPVLITPLRIRWDRFGKEKKDSVNFDAIGAYADLVQAVAVKRYLSCAVLSNWGCASDVPPTDNWLHLTEDGYKSFASGLLATMGAGNPGLSWLKFEPLRQAIVAKNQLFFYRWRPQNETYLFGFRKHEQGKNAKEVAEFDPLVYKAEKEIERIKRDLFK